jgi:hypothetical protein
MAFIIAVAVLAFVGLALILGALYRQVISPKCNLPVTAEWLNELSADRYRPMLRLLEIDDLEFLRLQPGFSPQMETKIRNERRQVFLDYLRCLESDFNRICAAIKLLMAQAQQDRPDLPSILVHHQVMFACGTVSARYQLFLHRCGLLRVDVADLVQLFDLMRLELRSLYSAQLASLA